jgi:hypothetical protein
VVVFTFQPDDSDICKIRVSCRIHLTKVSESHRKLPKENQWIFNSYFDLVVLANRNHNDIKERRFGSSKGMRALARKAKMGDHAADQRREKRDRKV